MKDDFNNVISIPPIALAFSLLLPTAKILYVAHTTGLPLGTTLLSLSPSEISLFSLSVTLILLNYHVQFFGVISCLLTAASLGWYGIDLISIIFLNNRAIPNQLLRVSGEATKLSSFQLCISIILIAVCVISPFIRVNLPLKFIKPLYIAVFCSLIAPLTNLSQPNEIVAYYEIPSLRWTLSPFPNNTIISDEFEKDNLGTLIPHTPWEQFSWRPDNPNVILLIVESLSTVDSKRSGGILNQLPLFDEISKKGILFTNLLANYYDTEGGLISLLNGVPPLPGFNGDRDLFTIYARQPTIVQLLNSRGYQTAFYTTADLMFLRKGAYLKKIGFSIIRGLDDIPAFKSAKRFAFDAPADEVLYQELLTFLDAHLSKKMAPLFLTAITVSSHLPWTDPQMISNTEDQVWKYVDQKLHDFVGTLEARSFFENGILIITGDHRKMVPVKQEERKLFGPSASLRVPLTIIGKGLPSNQINNQLLQQTDILRSIASLSTNTFKPSTDVISPERFSRPWLRDGELVARFQVLQTSKAAFSSYFGWIAGPRVSWESTIPPRAHSIAQKILAQRVAVSTNKRLLTPKATCIPYKGLLEIPSSPNSFVVYQVDTPAISEIAVQSLTATPHILSTINFIDILKTPYAPRTKNFGLVFVGNIEVVKDGWHYFRIESDDGACLLINDREVVNANYAKAFGHVEGGVFLTKGQHNFHLRYFQEAGIAAIRALWSTPEVRRWHPIGMAEKPSSHG